VTLQLPQQLRNELVSMYQKEVAKLTEAQGRLEANLDTLAVELQVCARLHRVPRSAWGMGWHARARASAERALPSAASAAELCVRCCA
jgi:hypothetical protein